MMTRRVVEIGRVAKVNEAGDLLTVEMKWRKSACQGAAKKPAAGQAVMLVIEADALHAWRLELQDPPNAKRRT